MIGDTLRRLRAPSIKALRSFEHEKELWYKNVKYTGYIYLIYWLNIHILALCSATLTFRYFFLNIVLGRNYVA